MEKSRLVLFLKCLIDEKEFEALSVYLNAESTTVKKKEMTLQLLNCLIEYCNSFEELKTANEIDKNEVFRLVEKKLGLRTSIPDRNRDDLMSYLVSVIEEFLILEELKTNADERNLLLSQVLVKRNEPVLFNQITTKLLKSLNKKPLKNIDNSFLQWRILHIQHFNSAAPKISKEAQAELQQLINQLNEFWLLSNYMYTIEVKNRRLVFNEEYQYLDVKQLEPHFTYNFTSDNHFLLEGYRFINDLLDGETNVFDDIIRWQEEALKATEGGKTTKRTSSEREELFGIHILMINFYSIKSSKGEENGSNQLFGIFKTAIDRGILDGAAVNYHYYLTVINLALGLGEKRWAEDFITKYAALVTSDFKDEIQKYVDWRLLYEKKNIDDYASMVREIQLISSSDIYLDIRYRILDIQILYKLSIKDIYYENLLKSRLGNFNDMLSNQKLIQSKSITVQANRNFIKIVRKLILTKYRRNVNIVSIKKLMNAPKVEYITERLWLERQLKEL